MIAERLAQFVASTGLTPFQFEKKIGVGKNSIAMPIKNNKTIGSEILGKIFNTFPYVSLEWLITGNGNMIISTLPDSGNKIPYPISVPNPVSISKSKKIGTEKEGEAILTENESLAVVSFDEPKVKYLPSSSVAVPVLDLKAAAATFGGGHIPDNYVDHLSSIVLPSTLVKRGRKYFFIPIQGESMLPTLLNGDLVLASIVEKSDYHRIETGRVYVIATADDGIMVKRIKNRLSEYGFLRAISDNVEHPGFNINADNIITILEISFKISFNLSNVATNLQNQIDDLVDRMEEVEAILKKPR